MISAFRRLILTLSLLTLAASASATDLVVSAAASLTNAFQEMKPVFEKAHPGTTLVFNFAASGALLKQIEQGAPVDVFASADQETMDKAAPLLDPSSRVDFIGNALVLVVPSESALAIKTPQDLRGDSVKLVAIGNPESVPVGRYAKASLAKDGLYEDLTPKFVLAESVRQALDYVARGEVQAGFVFASDAALRADKVTIAAQIAGHKPVVYPIAVIKASTNKDKAQAFVKLVQSAEGQAVLNKYGFKKL